MPRIWTLAMLVKASRRSRLMSFSRVRSGSTVSSKWTNHITPRLALHALDSTLFQTGKVCKLQVYHVVFSCGARWRHPEGELAIPSKIAQLILYCFRFTILACSASGTSSHAMAQLSQCMKLKQTLQIMKRSLEQMVLCRVLECRDVEQNYVY